MRTIHITNHKQRDATVAMVTVKPLPKPQMGLPGQAVEYRKYSGASESGLHDALQSAFGEDYGQALVDGDPEIDMEFVGRRMGRTDRIYLTHKGDVLHHAPLEVDVILKPDGTERERREPADVPANVTDEIPARWTGKRIPRNDVVHRFVLTRTISLQHVDGLTYDYLFAMAKDLHDSGEMMLVGGGESGKEPLILVQNGSPYRGLLEGRVEGEKYMLLLHLSNMELKRPEEESK